MNTYGGVDVQMYVFLTSALVGDELSASCSDRFNPGERAPGTHWVRGWMGPRAGVGIMEKCKFLTLPRFELRLFGRPDQINKDEAIWIIPNSTHPVWIAYVLNQDGLY
jgi:hypothetical protein